MQVNKVTVSKGVTVSVGKFESVRVDASIEINIDKGEDYDEVFQTGYELVDEQINAQVKELQDVVSDTSIFKEHASAPSSRKRR